MRITWPRLIFICMALIWPVGGSVIAAALLLWLSDDRS